MTADETGPGAQRARGRGTSSSAKAYERRSRREGTVAGRLTRTGSPVAAAMSRVPFVATIILLLAGGIVGVLWLNTMSDAKGLQATASRIRQAGIETDIESLRKDVNTLKDPARLAAEAARMGMVPAGDSALLQVGADGKGTVIGTPTPVAGAVAAAAPAAALPASTSVATTTATTALTTTAPAATAPAATTTAATTTAPATTAPAVTTPVAATKATRPAAAAGARTAATTGLPKTAAATTAPPKAGPAKSVPTTAARSTATRTTTSNTASTTPAPRTNPAQQTTTTGAGR